MRRVKNARCLAVPTVNLHNFCVQAVITLSNESMRLTKYITELIRVDSGHSSKAFFLVAVTLIGCVLLLCVAFVLIWEVMNSNTIHTDLMELSAFVGSVASLFVTAGITKVYGEKRENKTE